MDKRMVPLDLVLGILKDHPHAASRIARAFPKDDPVRVAKFEGNIEAGDVVVRMPQGSAHQLRDACNDARDAPVRGRPMEAETLKTLESLSKELVRTMGLLGP